MLGTAKLVLESDLPFETLKSLTPMQTLDEAEMRARFSDVIRKTKMKAEDTQAKILAM
jgi:hypothetical protein